MNTEVHQKPHSGDDSTRCMESLKEARPRSGCCCITEEKPSAHFPTGQTTKEGIEIPLLT